jgi:type II secretory pathway pseudopilin PulG
MTPSNKKDQNGNAMVIILIGIVLFAALAYAIKGSSAPSSAIRTSQEANIAADQIIRYAQEMESAVQSLMLSGTLDYQISFEGAPGATYINSNSANKDKIFHQSGGGLQYQPPQTDWLDPKHKTQPKYGFWFFPANVCIPNIGSGSTNCSSSGGVTTDEDIIVYLPWISKEVCDAINQRKGLVTAANLNRLWPAANTAYTGTFNHDSVITPYPGKSSGCISGSGTNQPIDSYHFYHVLVAR